MTNDRGVKDFLSFLVARDTRHQNQWLTAIKELEAKEFLHMLYTNSETSTSSQLDFLKHPVPDAGTFKVEESQAFSGPPELKPAPPEAHNPLPGQDK